MNFFDTMERISRLHNLIKNENTGNPEFLSKRLGISRATLYNIIDELKSMDAPINYSRSRETFFYTKYFELDIRCNMTLIEDEVELKRIIGGFDVFSSVQFFRRKDGNFTFESQSTGLVNSII